MDEEGPTTLTVELARKRHPALGRNRVYEAVRSGVLPGIRVGRRIAIHRDELDRWVLNGSPVR